MRFVVRADASLATGVGHVMRTSAIIETLLADGHDVIFVGNINGIPWVKQYLKTIGVQVLLEPEGYSHIRLKGDILILDSYNLSLDDFFLREFTWGKIILIFDESTPNYKCDLKIHPGIRTNWPRQYGTKIISGPVYTPVRQARLKKTATHADSEILQIIISGGGSDTTSLVLSLAKIISHYEIDFHATLITDKKLPGYLDKRFSAIPIGLEYDSACLRADVALTTASTSGLEFIAQGLATGLCAAALNQLFYYKNLASAGLASQLGTFLDGKWVFNSDEIYRLLTSSRFRMSLRSACGAVFDTLGSRRVVDEIYKLSP